MSTGPIGGVVGSAAGAPLSQTKGSAAERSQRDAASQATQRDGEKKAEQASGIGQTEEDQGVSDRDADGRKLWESADDAEHAADEQIKETPVEHKSKDATGAAGGQLDLMG